MTEPVAYYKDFSDGTKLFFKNNELCDIDNSDDLIKPLYTAEQLYPRVKMTRAEFDEFHDLFEKDFDLYSAITEIADTNLRITLYDRLFTGTQKDKDRQNEFAILWANYNPLEPEETIEIIPEKKWFVRSKKAVGENNFYAWLFNNDFLDVPAHMISDEIPPLAMKFDTKEQAEKWTNPLTEAVHLPVERE